MRGYRGGLDGVLKDAATTFYGCGVLASWSPAPKGIASCSVAAGLTTTPPGLIAAVTWARRAVATATQASPAARLIATASGACRAAAAILLGRNGVASCSLIAGSFAIYSPAAGLIGAAYGLVVTAMTASLEARLVGTML